MKRYLFSIAINLFVYVLLLPSITYAQTNPPVNYIKATVLSIEKEGVRDVGGRKNLFQTVRIQLMEGAEKDKVITLEHGGALTITDEQKMKSGDTVVVSATQQKNKTMYTIIDDFRLDTILYMFLGFLALVIGIAGRKGIGAILGMVVSLLVIFMFIVPQILQGQNPLLISITGSVVIMVVTIYLAHGFKQQTTIAVASTFLSLILTGLLATIMVEVAHLSGLGSEDAYTLQQGFKDIINFRGLLLGGIIIGTLGVLDDVTTTQTSTIYALSEANQKYSTRDLFHKGMAVGREHITSLVNTLVLAYAGASIGIFIFLHLGMQNGNPPLWVMLNSELIAEEVIRTLAGSVGLILAVPITTILAAFFTRYALKIK